MTEHFKWLDRREGRRCVRCGAKRWPMLRVHRVEVFVAYGFGSGGDEVRRVSSIAARCIDLEGCRDRVVGQIAAEERRAAAQAARRQPIYVAEAPMPGGPQGHCQWCGAPLLGTKPGRPPAKNRKYCHEDREGRACNDEAFHAITWSTRSALERTIPEDERTCADCGVRCGDTRYLEEPFDESGPVMMRKLKRDERGLPIVDPDSPVPWEADHEVPLWKGGPHELANLRIRCVPCHKAKTKREAAERAESKRLARVDLEVPPPSKPDQLTLDISATIEGATQPEGA